MGFLDRLLGREKKAEDMPAEPPMSREGMESTGMGEPPPAKPPEQPGGMSEPGAEGSPPEREQP
jgi:hypothetical protein